MPFAPFRTWLDPDLKEVPPMATVNVAWRPSETHPDKLVPLVTAALQSILADLDKKNAVKLQPYQRSTKPYDVEHGRITATLAALMSTCTATLRIYHSGAVRLIVDLPALTAPFAGKVEAEARRYFAQHLGGSEIR